jgi:hypothetical protein
MMVTYSATDVLYTVLTFESRPNRPVIIPFSTFWNVIICQFWEADITLAGMVFGGTCFNTHFPPSGKASKHTDWAFTKPKTVSLLAKYKDS